jgi:peptidoglycan/xylan/chitin deacetylase (PgdA/CDA1 family)
MFMFLTFRLNKGLSLLAAAVAVTVIVACCGAANPTEAAGIKVQQGIKLPIIMYHSMLKERARQGTYVVSPDTFESDIKYLKTNGYTTVVIQDLINYVNKDIPLPPKPVMLTFDDGYYNNYFYAYPIAKKYNIKMMISPIGYYTDLFSNADDSHPNYSHCTWDQITEMMNSGLVEIENHTYDLHSRKGGRVGTQKLKKESKEAYTSVLTADLSKMQQEMKEHTGRVPLAFVYPFGEVCQDSIPVLKNLGFQASLTCQYKMNYITKNPECLYCMGRYLRSSGTTSEQYFTKINVK